MTGPPAQERPIGELLREAMANGAKPRGGSSMRRLLEFESERGDGSWLKFGDRDFSGAGAVVAAGGQGIADSLLTFGRGVNWLANNIAVDKKNPRPLTFEIEPDRDWGIPRSLMEALPEEHALRLESRLARAPKLFGDVTAREPAHFAGEILTYVAGGGAGALGKLVGAPGAAIKALGFPGAELGRGLISKLPEVGRWAQLARKVVPAAMGGASGFGLYNYMTAEGDWDARLAAGGHGAVAGAALGVIGEIGAMAERGLLSKLATPAQKANWRNVLHNLEQGVVDFPLWKQAAGKTLNAVIENTGFAGLSEEFWVDALKGASGDEEAMDRAMSTWAVSFPAILMAKGAHIKTWRRDRPDINTMDTRVEAEQVRTGRTKPARQGEAEFDVVDDEPLPPVDHTIVRPRPPGGPGARPGEPPPPDAPREPPPPDDPPDPPGGGGGGTRPPAAPQAPEGPPKPPPAGGPPGGSGAPEAGVPAVRGQEMPKTDPAAPVREGMDALFQSGWEISQEGTNLEIGRMDVMVPGSEHRVSLTDDATGGGVISVPADLFRQVRGDVTVPEGTKDIRMVGDVAAEFLRDLAALTKLRRMRGETVFGGLEEVEAGGAWRGEDGRDHVIGPDGKHYSRSSPATEGEKWKLEPDPALPEAPTEAAEDPQIQRWSDLVKALRQTATPQPGLELLDTAVETARLGNPESPSTRELIDFLSTPIADGVGNADLIAQRLTPETLGALGDIVGSIGSGHMTADVARVKLAEVVSKPAAPPAEMPQEQPTEAGGLVDVTADVLGGLEKSQMPTKEDADIAEAEREVARRGHDRSRAQMETMPSTTRIVSPEESKAAYEKSFAAEDALKVAEKHLADLVEARRARRNPPKAPKKPRSVTIAGGRDWASAPEADRRAAAKTYVDAIRAEGGPEPTPQELRDTFLIPRETARDIVANEQRDIDRDDLEKANLFIEKDERPGGTGGYLITGKTYVHKDTIRGKLGGRWLRGLEAWSTQQDPTKELAEAVRERKRTQRRERGTVDLGTGRLVHGRPDLPSPVGTPARDYGRVLTARREYTPQPDVSMIPEAIREHLQGHQQDATAAAWKGIHEDQRGFLLASGTGAGKTRSILALARMVNEGERRPVIVVAPNEVLGKPFSNKNVVSGSYAKDGTALGLQPILTRGEHAIEDGKTYITTYDHFGKLDYPKNATVIFDEAHALKNALTTMSSRGLTGLDIVKSVDSVVFSTATPVDKLGHLPYLERAGILEGRQRDEQADRLGLRITAKKDAQGNVAGFVWAPKPGVPAEQLLRNLDALYARLTAQGKVIKHEISLQGVDIGVTEVALPAEAHEALERISQGFGGEEAKGRWNAVRLQHMRRQQEPYKVEAAVQATKEELAAGRKVVIFVSRVNYSEAGRDIKDPFTGEVIDREVYASSEGTAKQLRARLREEGITKFAELHGESATTAAEAMSAFQGTDADVMLATIESGGTGINLDDVIGDKPRTVLFLTPPFGAVENVQAAGRVHRLSTKSNSKIRYIIGDTKTDQWNLGIILNKMKTLGATVSGEVSKLSTPIDLERGEEDNPERGSWNPAGFAVDVVTAVGNAAVNTANGAVAMWDAMFRDQTASIQIRSRNDVLPEAFRRTASLTRTNFGKAQAPLRDVQDDLSELRNLLSEDVMIGGVAVPRFIALMEGRLRVRNPGTPRGAQLLRVADAMNESMLAARQPFVDAGGMVYAPDWGNGGIWTWRRSVDRDTATMPRQFTNRDGPDREYVGGFNNVMGDAVLRPAFWGDVAAANPGLLLNGRPVTGAALERVWQDGNAATKVDSPERIAAYEMGRWIKNMPAVWRGYEILEHDPVVALHRAIMSQTARAAVTQVFGQELPPAVQTQPPGGRRGITDYLNRWIDTVDVGDTNLKEEILRDAVVLAERLQGREAPGERPRIAQRKALEVLGIRRAFMAVLSGIQDIGARGSEPIRYLGLRRTVQLLARIYIADPIRMNKALGGTVTDAMLNMLTLRGYAAASKVAEDAGSLAHEMGHTDAGMATSPLTRIAEVVSWASNKSERAKTVEFDYGARFLLMGWNARGRQHVERPDDWSMVKMLGFREADARAITAGRASQEMQDRFAHQLVTTMASRGRNTERSRVAASSTWRTMLDFTGFSTRRIYQLAKELQSTKEAWRRGVPLAEKGLAGVRLMERVIGLSPTGLVGMYLTYMLSSLWRGDDGHERFVSELREFPVRTLIKAGVGQMIAGPIAIAAWSLDDPEQAANVMVPSSLVHAAAAALERSGTLLDIKRVLEDFSKENVGEALGSTAEAAGRFAENAGLWSRHLTAMGVSLGLAVMGQDRSIEQLASRIGTWRRKSGNMQPFTTPDKQVGFYKAMAEVKKVVDAHPAEKDGTVLWPKVRDQVTKALDLQPTDSVSSKIRSMSLIDDLGKPERDALLNFLGEEDYEKALRNDDVLSQIAREAGKLEGTHPMAWSDQVAMARRQAALGARNSWTQLIDQAVGATALGYKTRQRTTALIDELADQMALYPHAIMRESGFSDDVRATIARHMVGDTGRLRRYLRSEMIDRAQTRYQRDR